MSYLFDTNTISEFSRARPSLLVERWMRTIPEEEIFTSVLVLAELRKGVERLRDPLRQDALRSWLDYEIRPRLGSRALPITIEIADLWGRMLARGRTRPMIDSLIAATALHHGLTLVTRNVADYDYPGLTALNPWEPGTTQ